MKMNIEDRLNIWLSIAFEGAARTALQLEAHNGGAEEFRERLLHGEAELGKLEGTERAAIARACASESYLDVFLASLERDGVVPITKSNPAYPPLLLETDDPPYVLYTRGRHAGEPIEKPVSVIGTRHCSDYGRTVALMMGRALSECGATVISGLAYGCDSFAHDGALLVDGNPFPTAAVLGHGVLVEKTDSTRDTMEAILDRGMLISEYLPKSSVKRGSFPMRNRIISGISSSVLVVEAGRKSGTMITVNCALEQGRDVYAVPGRITDTLNCGTNDMLKKGWAQPVYGEDDLLEQLGFDSAGRNIKNGSKLPKMSAEQQIIYKELQKGEKSFDSLLEITGLSVEKLHLHLTELEFSSLIKQLPGRVYTIQI